MKWGALGGASRPWAWRVAFVVAVAGCSGELSSDAGPFGAAGDTGGAGNANGPANGGGGSLGGGRGFGGESSMNGGAGGIPSGAGGTAGSGGMAGEPSGQAGNGGTTIEPPPGTIPMFVAQGYAGRTIISCDDGHSWVADQSDHGWKYCESNDCDHHSGTGRSVVWAEGWFIANFGWGAPGSVRRSRDGVTWERVLEDEVFGGLAYGNGRLLGAHKNSGYSDDLGESWVFPNVSSISGRNARATAFVPYDGGRFLIVARSSSTHEIVRSEDAVSFEAAEILPRSCVEGVRLPGNRIAYGNGAIVTMGEDGTVCRSTDGGRTWTSKSITGRLRGGGVWTGTEFMAWDDGDVFRSLDGDTWSQAATVPGDVDPGAVAISDSGTFVSISGGPNQHYDSQVAYRSEDGVHWDVLPDSAFIQGHPIKFIAFGYGLPSEHCP